MANQDIVSIIVIQLWVGIAYLPNHISTDFREGRAEDYACISFKPRQSRQKLVNASQLEPFQDHLLVQQVDDVRTCVLHVCHRPKSKVLIEQGLNNLAPFAKGDMHLDGSLTVADVTHLLLGDSVDIFEDGGDVVVSHVLEGELPKLLVFIGIVFGVVPGVLIAATVAQPHVVASVGEHESRRLILIVDDPSVRTVDQPVLEDDGLQALSNGATFSLDSEHGEDVAVLGDHLMCLCRVVVVLAVGQELELCLRMERKSAQDKECQEDKNGLHVHILSLEIIDKSIISSTLDIKGNVVNNSTKSSRTTYTCQSQ